MFQSQFDIKKWTDIIINFFKSREVNRTPIPLDIDASEGTGYELGYLDTSDTYRISFFYLKLNRSIDQRKVGLRQLIDRYIKIDSDAGIGVFDDGNHWRLSFITDLRGEKTSPKRYTFVFGDKENKYRTAVDRFMDLQRKGISFANIKEAFSVEALTKQFYNDLFEWYTWALKEDTGVYFPNNPNTPADDRENLDTKMIRLITRLMFVWFIKQKGLVPDALFNPEEVSHWLKDFDSLSMTSANYYQAILQNLFFATLNRPIKTVTYDKDGNEIVERRGFAHLKDKQDVKSLYRYQELFKINEDKILSIFEFIPFINGGLFECLDKNKTSDGVDHAYFEDGFSRNDTIKEGRWTKRAFVPNKLFFDPEDGIISIFSRYNFTVEENSPSEQQVALDPELLGKVFENLLGVYNPETKDTARNQSGSFYTPREIVNYMVDISLQAYLGNTDDVKAVFAEDFVYDDSQKALYDSIIEKLKTIKVLDPACGSGAFPMGMLNRIIEIMERLNAPGEKYDLKLQIMENCIYGGDIQTIAAQITKLRFFISLVCDCKKTDNPDDNYGIPNLPNLETHFVTCDSLIGLKKPQQYSLFEQDVIALKEKLKEVRHDHFTAKTVYQKTKLRNRDKELRDELAEMLASDNVIASEDAKQMAAWNPYDQNAKSPFFDPEWMFGIKDGFDVVIGNPPYVSLEKEDGKYAKLYKPQKYISFNGKGDMYCLFYERGCKLLNSKGYLCYVTSNKWMRTKYGKNLQKFFLGNVNPILLVDFEGIKIFDAAEVDVNIMQISSGHYKNVTQVCSVDSTHRLFKDFYNDEANCNLQDYIIRRLYPKDFSNASNWIFSGANSASESIKSALDNFGTPLSLNYIFKIGIRTGCNKVPKTKDYDQGVYIINEKTRNSILNQCRSDAERERTSSLISPILRGQHIGKFSIDESDNLFVITAYFGSYKILETDYPAIYGHLAKYEHLLKERGQVKKTSGGKVNLKKDYPGQHHWLELDNTPSLEYISLFRKPKIMFQEMVKDNHFYLDTDQNLFCNNTCGIISGDNLLFLLGVLNSKLFYYAIKNYYGGAKLGTDSVRMQVDFIPQFPCIPYDKTIELYSERLSQKYSEHNMAYLNIIIYLKYQLNYEQVSDIELSVGEQKYIIDNEIYSNWLDNYKNTGCLPNEEQISSGVHFCV